MSWEETPVREIMSSPVRTVNTRLTVAEAARVLCDEQVGSVLVRADEDGIVTDTDIVRAVKNGIDPERTVVVEVMSSPVVTVGGDVTVRDAAARMNEHGIKKLFVTEGDGYAGVVTTTDIVEQMSPDLDDVIGMFAEG